MDQVPHIYQTSKYGYSTPLIETSTNLTCHVAQTSQAKHEPLVDSGAFHTHFDELLITLINLPHHLLILIFL